MDRDAGILVHSLPYLHCLITLLALCGPVQAAARDSTDDLIIESDPPGASVDVKPDGIHCKTPCDIKLARLFDYELEIDKAGYATVSVRVQAGSNQPRAEKHLTPNPVRVTLVQTGPLPQEPAPEVKPPTSSPPPLPEPVASLDNCIQPAAVDREACLGRIRLQMPRSDIEVVLGPPDGTSRDGTTLRYGDRFLKLDAAGRLAKISAEPL